MAALALATGGVILGTAVNVQGQRAAADTRQAGTEAQIEIEEQGREFTGGIFDKQIARQEPFVEAGKLALPDLVEAVQNKGDASGLPSAGIRRDIVGEFLGEQSPDFVKEQAFGDINAEETEINKNRLLDLVNVGVGGTGGVAQSGANLATDLSGSLVKEANLKGQSLQDQAIARQNQNATILRSLSALPALAVASRRD